MFGRFIAPSARFGASAATATAAARLQPGTPVAAAAVPCQVRNLADVAVEHVRSQWQTYGNLASYKPGKHHILTFNKISPVGLQHFSDSEYAIYAGDDETGKKQSNAHAILLRSHKLKEEEVPHTVRAIARYATYRRYRACLCACVCVWVSWCA
jgi:D-3-phosphoglycerate dehydrogenase / 2-oxoglutarate reductase